MGLFVASSAWAGTNASHDFDTNQDGVLSNNDFDDVRESMHQFEDWLNHLLKPFLQ